jgi:two-component system response regulator VicR
MGHKILVADDEKDIAETVQKKLLQEGYDVCLALDGEEAIVKVREENPDVIILDLMMPKKNGFEVLKEVRTTFKDKWRPVIIISALSDLESVKRSYALEADHYLTKPCSMENILRGVRTMISLIPLRVNQ